MLRALIFTSAALLFATPASASAHEVDDEDDYEEVEEEADPEPPPVAWRPDRPPSGVGFLISGGILTGLGVVNLATAAVCKTDLVRDDVQDECLVTSLVAGGVMLAVGIPLLAVGGAKRARFLEWQEQQPHRRPLPIVSFVPAEGGGRLVIQQSF